MGPVGSWHKAGFESLCVPSATMPAMTSGSLPSTRDTEVLFESRPGLGGQFRLDALGFWCDAQPLLQPATDESDAVILHLWQATHIVIDQAMRACIVAHAYSTLDLKRVHEAARNGPDDLCAFMRCLVSRWR